MGKPTSLEFRLEYPVVWKKETITSLKFRRRKAIDLAAGDPIKGQQGKFQAILASMCDQPLPVIQDLDGDDYDRLQIEIAPMMGNDYTKGIAAALKLEEEMETASP